MDEAESRVYEQPGIRDFDDEQYVKITQSELLA
jgi:hypothetical protein